MECGIEWNMEWNVEWTMEWSEGFHTLWWRWFWIQKFIQQAMYDTTEGTRLGYTCFLQQLLDLYSHNTSMDKYILAWTYHL